jgi:hypothetical protein
MVSRSNAEQAALALDRRLRHYPWYLSVGVGDSGQGETLYLYVRSKKHRELDFLNSGWMGFQVEIKPVGSMRPATLRGAEESTLA